MAQRSGAALTSPPEGVLAGESVPRENEYDERQEWLISEAMSVLKQRGDPYVGINEAELRERAIDHLRRAGEDL